MADNIDFMKCVFFTYQQFNIDKIHLPKQSLVIEKTVRINKKEELTIVIDKIIDDIYNKLNEGNTSGTPTKIPMPIFTLIGRKLDYYNSIFDNETITTDYNSPIKYGTAVLEPDRENRKLAIVDYFASFFKSGLGETPTDENKYKKSLANSYKFLGNIKIILYVPYLSNKYKYISNFRDISNSARFFFTLISKRNFLNFERTTTIKFDELKRRFKNSSISDSSIYKILEILRKTEKSKFGFYDDLYKLCYDGGCISDEGEDFERLLTEYTDDDGKNNENAIKMSPFLPNKCLAQTNGYIKNIRDATENNKDLSKYLKENVMNDLKEGLEKYLRTSISLIRDGNTNVNNSDIDNYKSPVDLIISIINDRIKKDYSTNLNDGGKPNYYSKEYSQNIIKELSLLRKFYPGIPEIVMSLYLYKETLKPDKIIYMPWSRTLVSSRNVLSLGDILEINKVLYSFNNKFGLTISQKGIIFVYEIKTGRIIYFLNRVPISNSLSMIFETNGISVQYIDNDKNQKSAMVNNISGLIDDCEECKNTPYSILLDDNDGSIIIYGNSFYDSTNRSFKSFIKQEMEFINDINEKNQGNQKGTSEFNVNNPEFIINIKEEEEYLFCSDINKECKK